MSITENEDDSDIDILSKKEDENRDFDSSFIENNFIANERISIDVNIFFEFSHLFTVDTDSESLEIESNTNTNTSNASPRPSVLRT